MSPNVKFCLENMRLTFSELKREETIRLISAQFKSLHLWWYRGALVPMELAACTSGKASLVFKGRWYLFQGKSCTFRQNNSELHDESFITAWLHLGAELACLQSRPSTNWKHLVRLVKQKIWQRRPKSAEQLESYIRQKRDRIPLPKVQQLDWNRGFYTVVNMALSQLMWDTLLPINSKRAFSQKMVHYHL